MKEVALGVLALEIGILAIVYRHRLARLTADQHTQAPTYVFVLLGLECLVIAANLFLRAAGLDWG